MKMNCIILVFVFLLSADAILSPEETATTARPKPQGHGRQWSTPVVVYTARRKNKYSPVSQQSGTFGLSQPDIQDQGTRRQQLHIQNPGIRVEGTRHQQLHLQNPDVQVQGTRHQQLHLQNSDVQVQGTKHRELRLENSDVQIRGHTPREDSDVCPGGSTGLFPYRSDCRRFVNCWKGRAFVQVCAPGTLFNPDTLECDFPAKVRCVARNDPSDPGHHSGVYRPRDRGLSPAISTVTGTGTGTGTARARPDCGGMPGGTGLAPHPTDCDKFLNCWKGTAHVQVCAPGTLFNPRTSQCDFPYRVDCTHKAVTEHVTKGDLGPPTSTGAPTTNWDGRPPTRPLEKPSTRAPASTHSPTALSSTKIPTTPSTTPHPPTVSTRAASTPRPPTTSTRAALSPSTRAPSTPNSTRASSTTDSPSTPAVDVTPDVSGQVLRLRGGPGPDEGYVELHTADNGWATVCDSRHAWSVAEATVVCRQLGYYRGAEFSWQGCPRRYAETVGYVAVDRVVCLGHESSLGACQLTRGSGLCQPTRDAVAVKCRPDSASECRPQEVNHGGSCYGVVPVSRGLGTSHEVAVSHCASGGARLLDITSQEENDFISELLTQKFHEAKSVLTSGVGVKVFSKPMWIWEGSEKPMTFKMWWPGWSGKHVPPPSTGDEAACVVLRNEYPCDSGAEFPRCKSNYFFWTAEECSKVDVDHFVCERPHDDIGCVSGSGRDYRGGANVSVSGSPCLPWDDPRVASRLKTTLGAPAMAELNGHNFCRNTNGGESRPWCYVSGGPGLALKFEYCDIPTCWTNGVKKTPAGGKCGPEQFHCQLGECVDISWVCDGDQDCSNGADELECRSYLQEFVSHPLKLLRGYDVEKWLKTSLHACARRCLQARDFSCLSFSYSQSAETCLLANSNKGLTGKLENNSAWDHYERKEFAVNCTGAFLCHNLKCVTQSHVCDGRDDCGDRSDERSCPADGYEIRLADGGAPNQGRLEIKVSGSWGTVCDDLFGLKEADVACRELGFALGASEARPHSSFGPRQGGGAVWMDGVQCGENATSLRECDFDGWGVHDCGPEEDVGVVCKVPGVSCPDRMWHCEVSKECVHIEYLCDDSVDCEDASDEDPKFCQSPVALRLADGSRAGEGRVEIRFRGVWGTVCDDDFGASEAAVVCSALGFGGAGAAEARKGAAFGQGAGPVWLDQIHCRGHEASLDRCLHTAWGETNCDHSEDVGVSCHGNGTASSHLISTTSVPPNTGADMFLPWDCGTRTIGESSPATRDGARVRLGSVVDKGSYPWQASLRVRSSIKSVHWCGAVVVSPLHVLTAAHCLQDYVKAAYIVRVGDHDTEAEDGTEQEANIDEFYIHEQFNKGTRLNNDIALVKLKGTGIRLGQFVRPICLPSADAAYVPGTNCTISGWGSVKTADSGHSRQLRASWVPLLAGETCRASSVYGPSGVSDGMFCAGHLDGGADSCQGDSGGPLVCSSAHGEWTLFGIISWGHGCGRPNKPGVYTKVAAYRRWLDLKIEESMTGR